MDLTLVSNDIVSEAKMNTIDEEKHQKVLEYIRSLKTIEDAIEPYAEQKRELRAEYKEQDWLTKEEISIAVKAYRLLKDETNIDELYDMFNVLRSAK